MNDKYIVALSGGRDSVALLHYLHQHNQVVAAVHVHHGLQAIADDWVPFCQKLCDELGVVLHVEYVSVAKSPDGVESAARNARYQALAKWSKHYHAKVATGHHADDNEETVLYQFLRGTGLKGLKGMQAEREIFGIIVCRPLLQWSRDHINQYCAEHQLTWIEDPSNEDADAYSRNYIRQLMPQLKQRFNTVSAAILRMNKVASDAQELIDDMAKLDLANSGSDTTLNARYLGKLSQARCRNAWRYWLETQVPYLMVEDRQLQEWIKQASTPDPKTWQLKGTKFQYKKGLVSVAK